jgi:hypothetical protein
MQIQRQRAFPGTIAVPSGVRAEPDSAGAFLQLFRRLSLLRQDVYETAANTIV